MDKGSSTPSNSSLHCEEISAYKKKEITISFSAFFYSLDVFLSLSQAFLSNTELKKCWAVTWDQTHCQREDRSTF